MSPQLVPAFASRLLSRLALGVSLLAAGISITSAVLTQSASAQTEERVNPLEGLTTGQGERDSITGETSGGFNPLNLVLCAQTNSCSIDFSEFSRNKEQELDATTESFREEFLRLNQQQLRSPENSRTTPPAN
ncbi:MAG: hypothetical protein LDL41_12840 [Coleofasciculus sp. S288]|nr:hypothetical protein [Coleofasciculus sp. S288]